jgi:Erg28 like protein
MCVCVLGILYVCMLGISLSPLCVCVCVCALGILNVRVYVCVCIVTPLTRRLFGAWTILASAIRFNCAIAPHEPGIYRATLWSFIIAFGVYASEVYMGTIPIFPNATAPFVVAGTLFDVLLSCSFFCCPRASHGQHTCTLALTILASFTLSTSRCFPDFFRRLVGVDVGQVQGSRCGLQEQEQGQLRHI